MYIALGLLGLTGLTIAGIVWLVVYAPGSEIDQRNIQKILSAESPVYYQDGVNRIGVFFEEAHRQYVPFTQMPPAFVNALVAAEDHDFFAHHGVDIGGILRALVANVRSGRVVQGGSTISQQTAKNLFKRRDRSLGSKLRELLFALRLEYHYPKEKILEFYANQFYVSGNGRGLGVAAKYFFNKPVADLDLLECAFIAGSVKSPNHYNPFIKGSAEEAAKARQMAQGRTAYVLKNMARLGTITAADYERESSRDIPFSRGTMVYSLNTIMDRVKEALDTPQVEEALSLHGIDNVATSGIRIITTVDKKLQDEAVRAVRKELSRLDVRLRGYERDELQAECRAAKIDIEPLEVGAFHLGQVTAVRTGDSPVVEVSLPVAGSVRGRIDKQGLLDTVTAWKKYRQHRWSQVGAADVAEFLPHLKISDQVYVSIREKNDQTGEYLLDLEKLPKLEGAAMVFKEGAIRAMVGGHANRYFNRAITAKRSMGSVIKPIVYAAALQLGWSNVDVLNNRRNIFIYQKMPYFPRPDHVSPHEKISMSWAGVHSENVATVWLLYHLCDRLAPGQFTELSSYLDLERRSGESYETYTRRIRDELGIRVDQDVLYQAAFEKAVEEVKPDLIFADRMEDMDALSNLHHGAGFDDFLIAEKGRLEAGAYQGEEQEFGIRAGILRQSFRRYQKLRAEVQELQSQLGNNWLTGLSAAGSGAQPYLSKLFRSEDATSWIYTERQPEAGWIQVSESMPEEFLQHAPEIDPQDFWSRILIENDLSVETIDLVAAAIGQEHKRLASLPPYSAEVLHQLRDFRVLVALRYLSSFCRAMGITSDLDLVLSYPLGSNVISVLEAAQVYECLITGQTWRVVGEGPTAGLDIIDRIEDSAGETIFTPVRAPSRLVDERTVLALGDILRNVIEYGTGRHAGRFVRLHSNDSEKEANLAALDVKVPVLGKTGTANRFTNAAFLGFLPNLIPASGEVELRGGSVLAAYVGFDDNAPMVRASTHITGATGALPIWTELANGAIRAHDFAERVDLVDLSFSAHGGLSLQQPDLGQRKVAIDKESGLVRADGTLGSREGAVSTTFGEITPGGEFQPSRFFNPFWKPGQ